MRRHSISGIFIACAATLLLWSCKDSGTGSTTESGLIVGRLLTPEKMPVAGAMVALLPSGHVPSALLKKAALAAEAMTDADGYYRIGGLPAGLYNVSAHKDSLASFRDSLQVSASGADAGTDTLRSIGSIAGRIELQPGDERRTVLILVLGTNSLTVPQDTTGNFVLAGLAKGEYRVRFLSTLPDYAPLDTLLRVRSGSADTLSNPIRLPYAGIQAVSGLQALWDPASQTVNLQWLAGNTSNIAGYNVYRAPDGAALGSTPLNSRLIEATSFRDTTIEIGTRYVYAVKAVDRNGNVGPKFPSPASVATAAEYVLSKTIKPEGYTLDPSPLAVADGEIYWLQPNRVDVYDTAGSLRRSFGKTGPGAILDGRAIRVFGDTVYVVDRSTSPFHPGLDTPSPEKEALPSLRKYSKHGAFLDSLLFNGVFHASGVANGAADFSLTGEGALFATNGTMIYSIVPGGGMDSTVSPLALELRNPFSKLVTVGDKFLIMGSMGNLTTGINTTQLGFLNKNLSLDGLDSAAYFLNAYASDTEGNIWLIIDNNRVQVMTMDLQVIRSINLPRSLYRDIQVEGDIVYIYDNTTGSILIYRK